jgi:WD40 repeat protein
MVVEGHADLIRRIQFSPSGELLLTASFDGRAGIWSTEDGENQMMLEHASGVGSADFNQDGSLAATATDVVTVWDLASAEVIATWPVPSAGPTDVEFSPDGTSVATAGWDGVVKLWVGNIGELIWEARGHQDTVIQVDFSDDGEMLATAGWDGIVKIWSVEDGEELWSLEGHVGEVWAVEFAPDGTLLASSGSDGAPNSGTFLLGRS